MNDETEVCSRPPAPAPRAPVRERWVITILRDNDVRRWYTGCRDDNDLRIFTDSPDDPATLVYASKFAAMLDVGKLVHDGIRTWAELA